MPIQRLLVLSAAALAISTMAGYAGPCSHDIDRMQGRVDAMIAAAAATGPAGPESSAATMHRQPTPGSIAAAEEKLGEGARAERALTALAQARAEDRTGNQSACARALAAAQRALGP